MHVRIYDDMSVAARPERKPSEGSKASTSYGNGSRSLAKAKTDEEAAKSRPKKLRGTQ
jgi:hypothetical protein